MSLRAAGPPAPLGPTNRTLDSEARPLGPVMRRHCSWVLSWLPSHHKCARRPLSGQEAATALPPRTGQGSGRGHGSGAGAVVRLSQRQHHAPCTLATGTRGLRGSAWGPETCLGVRRAAPPGPGWHLLGNWGSRACLRHRKTKLGRSPCGRLTPSRVGGGAHRGGTWDGQGLTAGPATGRRDPVLCFSTAFSWDLGKHISQSSLHGPWGRSRPPAGPGVGRGSVMGLGARGTEARAWRPGSRMSR